MIQCWSVATDSAERAVGLVSEFHTNEITKESQRKQCLYQVVKSLRLQQTKLEENWSDSLNICFFQSVVVD